jgi:lipopolysaccharide/colanic/teichoic acid biosynthesis glycosyltransferase
MSLVGPRPLIVEEARYVDGWARKRVDLKPGITGLWQVLGRSDIPFDEMVNCDYVYVTTWSLWGDVRLLFRTIPVVLGTTGGSY